MSVYLIVHTRINNTDGYQEYREKVPVIVKKYGGEYLARGGQLEVIEGDWNPDRIVLIRFPTAAAARDFFNDPDYQPLKQLRHRNAISQIVMVEGLDRRDDQP